MPPAVAADACGPTGWGPPPPVAAECDGDGPPLQTNERASACVALCTLLLSVPALVGSWCWPLLLAGLFSGLSRINTSATRAFSHSLNWGVDLAVMTNILQYVWGKTKQQRASMKFGLKWGPFNCCLLALFLTMADLTRHLANDAWGTACTELDRSANPGSQLGFRNAGSGLFEPLDHKYDKYCYSRNVANEFTSTGALSAWGWGTSVICTWCGFIFLFIGIFWAVNLPQKLLVQWRLIRAGRASSRAAQPGAAARTPLAASA